MASSRKRLWFALAPWWLAGVLMVGPARASTVAEAVGTGAVSTTAGADRPEAVPTGPAPSDAGPQWREALDLVAGGRFEEAGRIVTRLADAGVENPHLKPVRDWLSGFQKIADERAERKRKDYEQYIAWVREDVEQQKWQRAIATLSRAYSNAADPDRFRGESLVIQAKEGALRAAAEYEKARKWYKAAAVYVYLRDMFPKDRSYREAFDRCQEHIRLELSYAKDSEWESAVSGITPMMAIEAFKRIHAEYLKKPSFKECIVAALQQVRMLIEEPKAAKVFEKLGDADEVAEFRERIEAYRTRAEPRDEMSLTDMVETFERVLGINKEIQLVPATVLIREFVHGALKPLDRFTDMLWPADTDEFNKHTQGKFYGVGISIRKGRGEPIRVISPLEDTPAYAAGIRPGDLITHINGKPAAPYTINRAVQEITGPPDTTVTLTIERPGEEGTRQRFEVKLKRAEITIYTLKGERRDKNGQWQFLIGPNERIGYLRLTNFTDETPAELESALKSLRRDQQMQGLILDLRGNPGGTLKAAVEVTNLFLEGDKEIVSTRDRNGKDMQMSTTEPESEHFADFPMIVLINESSASASEIVAGALQVHHRALLVGERSFGKGSVQQVLPVTPTRQAFLKLTTALYYLPNGRCLHRDEDSETWGVDPDVSLTLVPKEAVKVANARLRNDILKGSDQESLTEQDFERVFATKPADAEDKPQTQEGEELEDEEEADDKEPPREDPNNWPDTDVQLEAAMLLMRVRLETNHPWPMRPQAVAATAKRLLDTPR